MENINDQKKEIIQKNIKDAIKNGDILMRPKWFFVLRGSLFVLGLIIVLLVSIFFLSFVVFMIKDSELAYALKFGARGYGDILSALPWLLILVTIPFVVLLEIMTRKFSFAYKTPVLYSLLAIIMLVGIGSVVLGQFETHERLSQDNVPYGKQLKPLYNYYATRMPERLHPGIITSTTTMGFILSNPRLGVFYIVTNEETFFPSGPVNIKDRVMVLGNKKNNTVFAEGIARVPQRGRIDVDLGKW